MSALRAIRIDSFTRRRNSESNQSNGGLRHRTLKTSALYSFFFFQAEDGIRYFHVTGVQTCALPISSESAVRHRVACDICERPDRGGELRADLHRGRRHLPDRLRRGRAGRWELHGGSAELRSRPKLSIRL